MPERRILVVEDRESLRRLLERALTTHGYQVTAVADGAEAIALVASTPFDLVLTDLKLPEASGLEVLRATLDLSPRPPVVVLTAYGTIQTAVEAMRYGAVDFLEKPVEIDDLYALIDGVLGDVDAAEAFAPPGGPTIIGRHPRMRASLKLLTRVAETDTTVLLTGESGTGKELFARALHALSARREGPFSAVNCAAIPETLLENELFGHEKGAFTGADRRQVGRFESASGGTLLLDEVGELGPGVQSKVLRVLEERTFERIGGAATVRADVRLVAATNRDLRSMVDAGTFRADLFYRLNVFPIELPPLRERASDVPAIARHLLERAAERHGQTAPRLDADAEELLTAQDWPGNVRQLANVVERALILADGSVLRAVDLRDVLAPLAGDAELQELRQALLAADGDGQKAAETLGVSYRTVRRRIQKYGLEGYPRYRR